MFNVIFDTPLKTHTPRMYFVTLIRSLFLTAIGSVLPSSIFILIDSLRLSYHFFSLIMYRTFCPAWVPIISCPQAWAERGLLELGPHYGGRIPWGWHATRTDLGLELRLKLGEGSGAAGV